MPFQVRSISFGEAVSKVYVVPPPTGPDLWAGVVGFAMLCHLSWRSISFRRDWGVEEGVYVPAVVDVPSSVRVRVRVFVVDDRGRVSMSPASSRTLRSLL